MQKKAFPFSANILEHQRAHREYSRASHDALIRYNRGRQEVDPVRRLPYSHPAGGVFKNGLIVPEYYWSAVIQHSHGYADGSDYITIPIAGNVWLT